MTKELDKKDWLILDKLCENSRLSHNQIAKAVGLSKNAVVYRIERLKKRGVITGFFTVIDYEVFGYSFYEVLLKIHANDKQEKEIIEWLKNHENLLVLDRVLGEWNFIMEFGCKNIHQFFKIINEFEEKFSEIIDVYEVHPILKIYNFDEQLPIELVKETKLEESHIHKGNIEIDDTDKELLFELNKDSTQPLYVLGDKLGLTSETISSRIKKLKEKGVIIRFTSKISLRGIGYDSYLVLLDLRKLSKEKEESFRAYLKMDKKIRYAFMSAVMPKVFIYIAVKEIEELDLFLNNIKHKFSDIIVNQNYLFSKEQLKYELFTEGLL